MVVGDRMFVVVSYVIVGGIVIIGKIFSTPRTAFRAFSVFGYTALHQC